MTFDDPEVAEMVEVSAPLVTSPTAWENLSADQQRVFRYLMPAEAGFDAVQRYFLSLWCLPATEEELITMNALMPPFSLIAPRAASDGTLYVGADLLSDALDARRLSALLPILQTLPLTYAETITWETNETETLT